VPQSSEIASRAPQSSRRRVSHRGAYNVLTVLSHSDAHPHAPQCLAVDRARDALTTLCPTNADTARHSASVSAVATVSRRCSVEYDPLRSDRNVPGRSRRRVGRGREPVRDYLVRPHIDRLIDDVTTSNLEGAGEVLGTDRPE
jgi:hypothetical protein